MRRRDDEGPEEVAFACALLCSQCGQLGWPQTGGGDPHRSEETTALARQPPCSHCGERSWLDLGRPSAALALREDEESHDEVRRRSRRSIVGSGAVAAVIGFVVGVSMVGTMLGGVTVGGLAAVAAGLSSLRGHRKGSAPRSPLPVRWSMALPPQGETTTTMRGPAMASGDLLIAPLSGRRCVAFEVGARDDDDPEADASTWALLEQKLAPLAVDGHDVDPASTHLRLPKTRFGRSSDALDEAARVFLQQRGLALDGIRLELYESVVEPDEPVELTRVGAAAILRPAPQG